MGFHGVDPNPRDGHDPGPLWWTASNGDEAVLRLLLQRDGIKPNIWMDRELGDPLSSAMT